MNTNNRLVYLLKPVSTDYKNCWDLQKKIHTAKQAGGLPDFLISTEHNNVYTLGKSGDRNHLLLNEKQLAEKKVSYFEIDRGGDLTYHGPGQLVCYPIFDLNNFYKDTHRLLRDLEEVIIRSLKEFGIESHRDEEFTGVWVGDEKICAIGIKVSRWITMHGLAFNVSNDLSFFENIIPCGIFHKGITSMKKLGIEKDFSEVEKVVMNKFCDVFGITLEEISMKELDSILK